MNWPIATKHEPFNYKLIYILLRKFCNSMACVIFAMSVYVICVIFKRLVVLQNSFAVWSNNKCIPHPFDLSLKFKVKLIVHTLFFILAIRSHQMILKADISFVLLVCLFGKCWKVNYGQAKINCYTTRSLWTLAHFSVKADTQKVEEWTISYRKKGILTQSFIARNWVIRNVR